MAEHPVIRAHLRDSKEGAQARPFGDEERPHIRRVQGVGAFVRSVRLRDVFLQDVVVHEEPRSAEREDERDNIRREGAGAVHTRGRGRRGRG